MTGKVIRYASRFGHLALASFHREGMVMIGFKKDQIDWIGVLETIGMAGMVTFIISFAFGSIYAIAALTNFVSTH